MSDCIFCSIVAGESPCHKVWEDADHLAFLTIFPNTEGVTVVIPKQHVESYAFAVPEKVLLGLTAAAATVGRLIDAAYDDVGRTAMVFEGLGVNHLHAKLYPLHGTEGWKPGDQNIETPRPDTFFEQYPGYVSSHDGARADDAQLAKIAEKIRNAANE